MCWAPKCQCLMMGKSLSFSSLPQAKQVKIKPHSKELVEKLFRGKPIAGCYISWKSLLERYLQLLKRPGLCPDDSCPPTPTQPPRATEGESRMDIETSTQAHLVSLKFSHVWVAADLPNTWLLLFQSLSRCLRCRQNVRELRVINQLMVINYMRSSPFLCLAVAETHIFSESIN